MMQNVSMGGGFITNVIHTTWMRGADEGNMDLVREAKDFMGFLGPYRSIGDEFEKIYRGRTRK